MAETIAKADAEAKAAAEATKVRFLGCPAMAEADER